MVKNFLKFTIIIILTILALGYIGQVIMINMLFYSIPESKSPTTAYDYMHQRIAYQPEILTNEQVKSLLYSAGIDITGEFDLEKSDKLFYFLAQGDIDKDVAQKIRLDLQGTIYHLNKERHVELINSANQRLSTSKDRVSLIIDLYKSGIFPPIDKQIPNNRIDHRVFWFIENFSDNKEQRDRLLSFAQNILHLLYEGENNSGKTLDRYQNKCGTEWQCVVLPDMILNNYFKINVIARKNK